MERAIAALRASSATARRSAAARASLSRFHWYAGDGDAARRKALEAIEILEPLGESVELARAYSGVSQLAMLAEDDRRRRSAGASARSSSRRGSATSARRAHALVNIGSAKLQLDDRETATLLEAHAVADAARATGTRRRARSTTSRYSLMVLGAAASRRCATPSRALAYAQRARGAHARAVPRDHRRAGCGCAPASGTRPSGRARREIERGMTVPQLLAKTVLAELAVRRGDDDAAERLADLARAGRAHRRAAADRAGARAGGRVGADDRRADAGRAASRRSLDERRAARAAGSRCASRAWARVAGLEVEIEHADAPPPHAAMLARRLARGGRRASARSGGATTAALMLSLLDDEESLAEAIEIARGLGAEPLDAARRRGGCASSGCASRTARASRRARTRPA